MKLIKYDPAHVLALVDAVLEGRFHADGTSDLEVEIRREVRAGLVDAVRRWSALYDLRQTARWARLHGVNWRYEASGEHHALCRFCGENLATLGRGSHRLSSPWIDKLEAHTIPCGLRGLINDKHWRGPTGRRRRKIA